MLKGIIDNDSFGKLDETQQGLYKQDGDNYVLQVEGMVTKDKLSEFRDNNVALKEKLEQFDGIDVEEYKKLKKAAKDDRLKNMSKDEKFEVERADWQAKLDTALSEVDKLKADLESAQGQNVDTIKKFEIQGALTTAFQEHKIKPELQSALTAEVNSMFTVKEGKVVAMDGDKIVAGANGNLTISEFIGNKDDVFKIDSVGGKGSGSMGNRGVQNRSSTDKISAGLKKRNSA